MILELLQNKNINLPYEYLITNHMKKIKKEDLSLNPKTVAHLSEDARKVSDSENANKAGKWLSEDKKCEDYTLKNC